MRCSVEEIAILDVEQSLKPTMPWNTGRIIGPTDVSGSRQMTRWRRQNSPGVEASNGQSNSMLSPPSWATHRTSAIADSRSQADIRELAHTPIVMTGHS
jgi:hypothetical protein